MYRILYKNFNNVKTLVTKVLNLRKSLVFYFGLYYNGGL